MPAKTNSTIAKVPEITFVKNKTAITAATNNLKALSKVPIFFFIIFILDLILYLIGTNVKPS